MSLKERLTKLERRLPATCPSADYHRIELCEEGEPEPPSCPVCGQKPFIIMVVRPEGV